MHKYTLYTYRLYNHYDTLWYTYTLRLKSRKQVERDATIYSMINYFDVVILF